MTDDALPSAEEAAVTDVTGQRTLIILRHAKAERPDAYVDDFDRPLAPRGWRDGRAAGAWLAAAGFIPDAVLCSSAVRTKETWAAVAEGVGESVVVYEPRLYSGGVSDAVELIAATQPTVSRLLVIGHNPTVSMLSGMLNPAGTANAGLATSGIAVHRLDGSWNAVGPGRAPLIQAHTARELSG